MPVEKPTGTLLTGRGFKLIILTFLNKVRVKLFDWNEQFLSLIKRIYSAVFDIIDPAMQVNFTCAQPANDSGMCFQMLHLKQYILFGHIR